MQESAVQARYEAVQKRLDKLYDDKLYEKITPDFYNRKFQQYSEEKDEVAESIKRHSQANTGYLNLGINIYELSQRAKEIYLKAKAKDMLDEQRSLIRLVFADLRLNEGKLSYTYSKTFKILSEAVEATNGSNVDKFDGLENKKFEPAKKNDVTGQKDSLLPSRPILLPRPRLIIGANTTDFTRILQAFQNVAYIGELRERWEEIKRLQNSNRLVGSLAN